VHCARCAWVEPERDRQDAGGRDNKRGRTAIIWRAGPAPVRLSCGHARTIT